MSIKKISELTGASISTVSRVLNDANHKCSSEELKQKILQTAREIGYVPNEAARSLKKGSKTNSESYLINIMLTRENTEKDPFYSEILRLAEIEIRRTGNIVANVRYCTKFSDPSYCRTDDIEKEISDHYRGRCNKSDGLIIIGDCCSRALQIIKQYEKNIIAINRDPLDSGIDEVYCDGRKIAEQAVTHLIKCGHRKIAYVGECRNEMRFTGFQAAMLRYNLEWDMSNVFEVIADEERGAAAPDYFMKQPEPPTAIYCSHDIIAVGLLRSLSKRRNCIYKPSVISSDDIAEAQYTSPMLTTIAIPKEEMVRLAMMLLINRINSGHKSISRLEVNGTLIIRESCRSVEPLDEPEYYI